jgi:hypothetical protein
VILSCAAVFAPLALGQYSAATTQLTAATASVGSGSLTLSVLQGALTVSATAPSSISAPVNASKSGDLPPALWQDSTGTGNGWQGSIAVSNVIYTGHWFPKSGAPALSVNSSAVYSGKNDGDTYTFKVLSSSGSTIDYSYSSTGGAAGTGTATTGTPAAIGSNGLTITCPTGNTYSAGEEYQIHVGSQNQNSLVLEDSSSGASIVPYAGSTSPSPVFVNPTAALTGDGANYGTAVPFVSAAVDTGMGAYTITPEMGINTDVNSWAQQYTANIEYTVASGPAA